MPIRHIRRVREKVVVDGVGVICVVGAVASAGHANMGTVNLWPVGDHVLVDHAAEKGIAA